MKPIMTANAIIKVFYMLCVTAMAIYFNNIKLLAWYSLLLVLGYSFKTKDDSIWEWKPINDLPKEKGRYLCYFKYEPDSPNVICENTYMGNGRWMSEQSKITHWNTIKLSDGLPKES